MAACVDDFSYRPGLNQREPLGSRVLRALDGAEGLDIAVAYAKFSGVSALLGSALPHRTRTVIGLDFGLSDPEAFERLESAGADVRAADPGAELRSFHPKLYLVERPDELVVLSGSANLTGGGWYHNVEQYEELAFERRSARADAQRERFEEIWDLGVPLDDLRRTGDWEAYRRRAEERRRLERADRGRVLRLDASAGRLVGRLARADTRRAPGYLGITHPDWWAQQLLQRSYADRALFWRRSTTDFKALATGGVFFHLVRAASGREEERAVQGFSIYAGRASGYDVIPAEGAWRRYGALLGVTGQAGLYERLSIQPGRLISIIHLEQLTELDRAVTLEELRANGVSFERNIVSGRGLTLEELAVIFELGGLGEAVAVSQDLADDKSS